ncbi:MAG: hypothetical protein ACREFE_08185 [Limisphaerales bacterium]
MQLPSGSGREQAKRHSQFRRRLIVQYVDLFSTRVSALCWQNRIAAQKQQSTPLI